MADNLTGLEEYELAGREEAVCICQATVGPGTVSSFLLCPQIHDCECNANASKYLSPPRMYLLVTGGKIASNGKRADL